MECFPPTFSQVFRNADISMTLVISSSSPEHGWVSVLLMLAPTSFATKFSINSAGFNLCPLFYTAFASYYNFAALLWYSGSSNERCWVEASNFWVKWVSRSRKISLCKTFLDLWLLIYLIFLSCFLLVVKGIMKFLVKIQSKYINRWKHWILALLPEPYSRCFPSSVLLLIVQSLLSPQHFFWSHWPSHQPNDSFLHSDICNIINFQSICL